MASIFMSFIHEEESAADDVKNFIREVLGDEADTFMSSDKTAIYAGEDWMTRILDELKTTKVLVSMLSPISVHRPWINFEAGAAWKAPATVIPVCFGGMTVGRLPKPYTYLQAVEIGTPEGAYYLANSIAHHLSISTPKKPLFIPRAAHGMGGASIDMEENETLARPYRRLAGLIKLDAGIPE